MRARWSMIRLIAGREIRDRFRRPSYYAITGLFVVLILAFGVGHRLVANHAPGAFDVAVTGHETTLMTRALVTSGHAAKRTVHVHPVATSAEALASFDDRKVDLVVDTDRRQLVVTSDVDTTEAAIVRQAWAVAQLQTNLARAGLSDAVAQRVLEVPPLATVARSHPGSSDTRAIVTGTLTAALLFMSLQIFGGQILSGVVEEKSTAVVEVLLARVRADELLAGKVLGIGVAAVTQFSTLIVAGLVSLWVSGASLPGAIWTAVPLSLAWYLAGFAFYSMLFALAGALVSRQEEAAGAAAPVTTALIGAYALLFVVGSTPGSALARVLSLVPPFAPILMPLRTASGSAAIAEIVAAFVLLALSIVVVWKFTARVYAQVLLRRGSRITWATVWATSRGKG